MHRSGQHEDTPDSMMPLSAGGARGLSLAKRTTVVGGTEKSVASDRSPAPRKPTADLGAKRKPKPKPHQKPHSDDSDSDSDSEPDTNVGSNRTSPSREGDEQHIDGDQEFLDKHTHEGKATISLSVSLNELAKTGGRFVYEIAALDVVSKELERIVVTNTAVVTMHTDQTQVPIGVNVVCIPD